MSLGITRWVGDQGFRAWVPVGCRDFGASGGACQWRSPGEWMTKGLGPGVLLSCWDCGAGGGACH